MVCAAICATSKTPVMFLEKGVKMNQTIYIENFREFSSSVGYNHHTAKFTQNWLFQNFPSFITSEEWPPYSPDLNSIWGFLEQKLALQDNLIWNL